MAQTDHNAAIWRGGAFVAEYDNRLLLPAEALLLSRYREALSGRVLEGGCGAGRLLGYLVQLGGDVDAVDISLRMVSHCRRLWPTADVRVGDLEALAEAVSGPFDAILLGDNVLDVFDDARRRAVLHDIHALLASDGLLVFSSHNLADFDLRQRAAAGGSTIETLRRRAIQVANRPPAWMFASLARVPRRRANRRRLAALEHRTADHAVLNDEAHDFALLHYYIGRADQERQLEELGFETIEVLEFSGSTVPPGEDGRGSSLYYVARAVSLAGAASFGSDGVRGS